MIYKGLVYRLGVYLRRRFGHGRSWKCNAYFWWAVLLEYAAHNSFVVVQLLISLAHYFASPKTRNPLSFLVGYSNTLGLVGGLCSIDYGFALMFVSVIVIARDGEWEASNGIVYVVFMCCVLVHGILASTISKSMAKLQTVFVV